MKLLPRPFRTSASWSFARVPGAAQHERSEVVRCRPGTVPVRGGPGSAMHRSALLRAASHPGHTIPTVIRHSCLTTSNNTHSLVAARFCVNALSPQHALAGPIPVFSCFSADSDLPSRLLRSQTTRTPPFQHTLPPSRGAFLRPGFASLLHSPRTRGGRSAEKRSGARRNTRGARHSASKTRVNALSPRHAQAPSEAPCVP
jgi:hypothetical protein